MKKLLSIAIVLSLSTSMSCRLKQLHPVPDIPFNISIDINLPTYSGIQSIGGYAYIENIGVKGIVVYRRNMYEFVAFDRMSTAPGGDTCAPLYVDPDNLLRLLDPCTSSTWSLFDGSLIDGPAEWGLRAYFAELYGNNILNIRN